MTREKLPMAAAVKLRGRRLLLGLSLQDVAHRADTTKSHLSEIERGNNVPSVLIALRLAAALATSVEGLFGDDATIHPVKPELARSYRLEKAAERAVADLRDALGVG